jgi:hypothetical protein
MDADPAKMESETLVCELITTSRKVGKLVAETKTIPPDAERVKELRNEVLRRLAVAEEKAGSN